MGIQMKLFHHRLKLSEAQEFVAQYHRHSDPLKRHVFSIGASVRYGRFYDEIQPLGIVTVDRCSSAWSKRRDHIEIRRLCTRPDTENLPVASFLLGKAKQACFAMGYRCIITYTKPHEKGASLKAAGFHMQRWRVRAFEGGRVDGRVQWICVDGQQPSQNDRKFTKDGLEQMASIVEEFAK
jgi:hypothetical protein